MGTVDRQPYLTSEDLTQSFLNQCADNLENKLEFICDIERPDGGVIRVSDRNKYVGPYFYEALTTFPIIERTVGDFLSPEIQFSELQMEISNVDGRFNPFLPGGEYYKSFVGRLVIVKLGLAEEAETYKEIYRGKITDVGGFSRSTKTINLTARDKSDSLNVDFPSTSLDRSVYPDLEEDLIGKILPVIYGDYATQGLEPDPATIPAFPVNGASVLVNGGDTDPPDPSRYPVQLIICENNLKGLDQSNVYLRRSDKFYRMPGSTIINVGTGYRTFSITQGAPIIPDEDGVLQPWLFEVDDEFFVRVIGKDLGGPYTNNIVAQAYDILKTYAGLDDGDFHFNWYTVMDIASPPENAIFLMPARAYIDEPISCLKYALSMLEQVRVEAFIDRGGKLKLLPLHFNQFEPNPEFAIKNWDLAEGTLVPYLDDRNNFNRARAAYDYHPSREENARLTAIYKNDASIAQVGKALESKLLEYPNLIRAQDVENQLKETLRVTSALFENIDCTITWRGMLLDIGDMVKLDVKIGSTVFANIPCLIRDLGYDPNGIRIPLRLWSFQLLPFAGYSSGSSGIIGGYQSNITNE